MNKILKFTLMTTWIIFSRAYDAYCSVQYTPDLSREANPLVTVLGLNSWTIVLTIISFLSIGLIYLYYRATFSNKLSLPKSPNLSFTKFSLALYLGDNPPLWSKLFQIPNSYVRFEYVIGQLLAFSIAFAGIVSTIMWLLINYVPGYLNTYHSAKVIYTILIVGSLFMAYLFFRSKYRVYQHAQLSIT